MWMRISIFVPLLFAAMTLWAPARGGSGPASGPHPGGALLNRPLDAVAEQLGLDAEQKKALAGIRTRFERDTKKERAQARELRQQMRALWTSGEVPEKAEVMKLQSRMRGLHARMAEQAVDARIEALRLMTPEQRRRMSELAEDRMKRRRERASQPQRRGRIRE